MSSEKREVSSEKKEVSSEKKEVSSEKKEVSSEKVIFSLLQLSPESHGLRIMRAWY